MISDSVRTTEEIAAYRESLRGTCVAVIGAARSGVACAELLAEAGARVTLADRKSEAELADATSLAQASGVDFLGGFGELDQLPATDLMVVSPGVPPDHAAILAAEDAGIEVIGTMELAWRLCPAPIIAITGTNGKGTCCRLLAGMLERGGVAHILAGNIGNPLAAELHRASASQLAVVEISSFQLLRTVDFRPRVAAMLNITPDHLDWHPDFRHYVRSKARVFRNQLADDVALVNLDDHLARYIAEGAASRALTIAAEPSSANARVEGPDLIVDIDGASRRVCGVDDFPIPGRHYLTGILVAATCATMAGVEPDAIAAAVRAYQPPLHHMQLAAEVGGVAYYNDSKATNPAAAMADLSGMDRPYVAIVGGKDKGAGFAALGRLLARESREVVLIGEAADRIASAMGPAATPERAATLEDAVRRAAEMAEPGDAVIMAPACSSFDMFRDYEQRGEVFMRVARELAQAGFGR